MTIWKYISIVLITKKSIPSYSFINGLSVIERVTGYVRQDCGPGYKQEFAWGIAV
jgi:hypothetical protein